MDDQLDSAVGLACLDAVALGDRALVGVAGRGQPARGQAGGREVVGMALQLVPPAEGEEAAAGGHGGGGEEEPAMSAEQTARAVDEAISLFGSKTMDQLRLPKQRQEAKKKLVHALEEAYHGDVVDVYFTAFAMQ